MRIPGRDGDMSRSSALSSTSLVVRLHGPKTLNAGATALETIAHGKVQHLVAEANSPDAARMLEIQPQKRYTLAAAPIRARRARTLDDLGQPLIRRMTKILFSTVSGLPTPRSGNRCSGT
jgi:hypothetical protein